MPGVPAGTLLTAKCPVPGTHRASNARGLPGRMLAARIDSHIIKVHVHLTGTSDALTT